MVRLRSTPLAAFCQVLTYLGNPAPRTTTTSIPLQLQLQLQLQLSSLLPFNTPRHSEERLMATRRTTADARWRWLSRHFYNNAMLFNSVPPFASLLSTNNGSKTWLGVLNVDSPFPFESFCHTMPLLSCFTSKYHRAFFGQSPLSMYHSSGMTLNAVEHFLIFRSCSSLQGIETIIPASSILFSYKALLLLCSQ